MGLSSSSALASNSTSTDLSAWLTDTSRKPRVCDPVGWFLVRRKRCRMASSVSASGSGAATSLIQQASFLPELVEGDDGGRGGLLRRRLGLGLRRGGRGRGLGVLRRGRRSLELQQELHRRIVEAGDGRVGD